jgi:cytochrome c biogenesis protein ResB
MAQEGQIEQVYAPQIVRLLNAVGLFDVFHTWWFILLLGLLGANITLASIVRHVEGAMAPVSCVSERFYERCTCPDEARCPIRDVMKEAREAVVKIMERLTLADLRDRARRLEKPGAAAVDFVI